MILFIANNDLDLLALRVAVEALPDGFPPVRAHGGIGLDPSGELPDLDGRAGGAGPAASGAGPAWSEPFDELRGRCRGAGHRPAGLRRRGGPRRRAHRPVDGAGGIVAEAFAYLVHGGPANLGQPAALRGRHRAARGLRLRAADRRSRTSGILADHGPTTRRGRTVGVVFYRANLLAGNTLRRRPAVRRDRGDGAPTRGPCGATRCAGPSGAARPAALALLPGRRRGRDTTVLAAGGVAARARRPPGDAGGLDGEGWDVAAGRARRARHAGPSSTGSAGTWATATPGWRRSTWPWAWPSPSSTAGSSRPRSRSTRWSTTATSSASPVAAYRTVPDRVGPGRRHRRAPAPRLRRTPPADKRVAIVLSRLPDQAQPARQRRRARHAGVGHRPARRPARTPATRSTASPADGDALMAELADGLTYDAESLTAAAARRGRRRGSTATRYADWFATLPADAARTRSSGAGARRPATSPHPRRRPRVQPASTSATCWWPSSRPRGYGDDPVAVYHSPDLPPRPPLPGLLPLARRGAGAPTPSSTSASTARSSGCPARRVGAVGRLLARRRPRRRAALLPVRRQRPRRGHPGQAPGPRRGHRPPPAAHDPGRHLRRPGPARAAARRVRPGRRRSTRPSCRRCASQIWDAARRRRDRPRPRRSSDDARRRRLRRRDRRRRRLPVRAEGRPDPRRPAHPRRARPRASRWSTSCWPSPACPTGASRRCGPPWPPSSASTSTTPRAARRASRPRAASCVEALAAARLGTPTPRRPARRCSGWPTGSCPTLRADRPTRSTNLLAGLDGRYVPAGPSGAPTRGGAHVLPTGRNFYSRRPQGAAHRAGVGRRRAAGRRGCSRATWPRTGTYPRTVGLVLWGTAAMRTQGDDVAEALALLGVRPRVGARSRGRVVGLEPIPLAELGRPRVDVTLRISGFFRDAFPHLVAPARRRRASWSASLDEPAEQNSVRAHGTDDARVFGPRPAPTASGILAAARAADWRIRRRPRRGVPRLVRLRLRPRTATASPTPRPCAGASPPSRWR